MIQRRQYFGFAVNPGNPIRVLCKHLRQDFHCNTSIELRVTRAIDLAQTALAEMGRDFERAKACTYIYRQ
jgi:hypothetical protein